jgi:hypothetical protein
MATNEASLALDVTIWKIGHARLEMSLIRNRTAPHPEEPVPRRYRQLVRHITAVAAFAPLLACGGKVEHLSYDGDGVAKDVAALIPFNTAWAQSKQPDAVLYRIELRSETPGEGAPTDALYSYFSAGSRTFMTATSDPRLPWAGAEPQDWPADRPVPLPLPRVTMDFKDVWKLVKAAGMKKVTTAVLEVNRGSAVPVVVWAVNGEAPDIREGGIFYNAVSGVRMLRTGLFDPPASPRMVDNALTEYRAALRGDATGPNGCSGKAVAIPAQAPVVCFDAESRQYSVRAP